MQWWQVEMKVPHESAEAFGALLQDWPEVKGVSMEGDVAEEVPHPEYGEWFSEALLRAAHTIVTVYLPESTTEESIRQRLNGVISRIAESGLPVDGVYDSISVVSVDEASWETAWKDDFDIQNVGRSLVIVPTWKKDVPRDDHREPILMEPGMAFGTGTHATTQLCLEAIEDAGARGAHVVDVGCGTAVLAIGAARLGADRVLAIDIDPVAVHVATENVAMNGLSQTIDVKLGDLLVDVEESDFDLAVANILRDSVMMLSPAVYSRLRPGGTFISSGYVDSQADMVRGKLEEVGFLIKGRLDGDGWVVWVAVKPS